MAAPVQKEEELTCWVVEVNPKEWPGGFLARGYVLEVPQPSIICAGTLEHLREILRNMGRRPLKKLKAEDAEVWV